MKPLGHYRLASLAAGDDTTLSRYVRDNRATAKPKKHQPRLPGLETAFIRQGRTKFPSRVMPIEAMTNLLVSGHSNVKIGRDVRKGKHLGYWIYTLSLEERKTCPSSCQHWQSCYGNNMPFAKRIDHTDPAFLPALEAEIDQLCIKRYGVLIRLHALGDFYSSQYVLFWQMMLDRHPNLAVYGYTAHDRDTTIGGLVARFCDHYGKRWMVRHSNGKGTDMNTVSIAHGAARPPTAFICPEQSGKVANCATCGACWGTTKTVAFMEH